MFNKKFRLLFILIILLIFLLSPASLFAMTLTISDFPNQINYDQETEVSLYFECTGCGDTSYLRGVFYPSGTNYFGYTLNNQGQWIQTSTDRSVYFSISKSDLLESTWSGKLKVKPDYQDSAFNGSGEYFFKVGRYTSASDSSADWSNETIVKIIAPTPTVTPTLTPIPTATQSSTSTPNPTATSIITPKPTPTKTPTPSSTPEEIVTQTPFNSIESDSNVNVTTNPQVLGIKKGNNKNIISFAFILVGIIFLGYAILYMYNKRRNNLSINNN